MRSAAATPASACTTDPGGRGHNPGPSRPAPPEGAPGGGLPAVGVDLIGTDPPIDPSTPSGRLLFRGLAAIGEFERDLIRERTQAGPQAARRRAGLHQRVATRA